MAEDELRGAQALAQKIADELLRLREREVARERDDEKVLDPERLDRLLLLAERLDAARGLVRAQDRQRVRLERDRDGRPYTRGRDATAVSRIRWCPRWTPSKFPMVTIPRGEGPSREGDRG